MRWSGRLPSIHLSDYPCRYVKLCIRRNHYRHEVRHTVPTTGPTWSSHPSQPILLHGLPVNIEDRGRRRKNPCSTGDDSIEVDDLGSNTEWDDIETEVYNQLLQRCFTPIISEAEALHQVVPLAAGQTLGVTLCPRRGSSNRRGNNDGFSSD